MERDKAAAALEGLLGERRPLSVTVALSGGADSMALLHMLLEERERFNYILSAAHLNHMLRGAEADRDEAFVRRVCAELSIPLRAARVPVAQNARPGESLETAARRVRYAFLEEAAAGLADRAGCGHYRIATAHHLDDQAETVLFRLIRGSGLKGLSGIPPMRGRIIRPLLDISRREIEDYCREKGIAYVTDSTNHTDDYARNRIRRQVMPVLTAIQPGAAEALGRFARTAGEEDAYLDRLAAAALETARFRPEPGWDAGRFWGFPQWDGRRLLEADPVLLRRMLRLICAGRGFVPEARHIELLEKLLRRGGGREELPGGRLADLQAGRLRLLENRRYPDFRLDAGALLEGKTIDFPGGRVRVLPHVDQKSADAAKINNLLFKNGIDCDKIKGKIVLRSRAAADYIHPVHRSGGKELRRWLQEMAVPSVLRSLVPVLADDQGPLWVGGLGADRRAAAADGRRRWILCWEPADKSAAYFDGTADA